MIKRLEALAPKLTAGKRSKLARWMANKSGLPSDSDLENLLNQSFKKGDENIMKHALDIMLDRKAEERAKKIARSMLAKNKPIDEIAEFTELDLSTVLMLQSEMA